MLQVYVTASPNAILFLVNIFSVSRFNFMNRNSVHIMSFIFKICFSSTWQLALSTGVFTGEPIDIEDGFIHFSTAEQLPETAVKHFSGQSNLMLLSVKEQNLLGKLRYEQSRGNQLFPHLYAPLPIVCIHWAKSLALDYKGAFIFPDLTK